MFYVISEISFSEGTVKFDPIGFTDDVSRAEQADATSDSFRQWLSENSEDLESGSLTPVAFFTGQKIFCLGWASECLGDCGLEEITDFSFLGGE